MSGNTISTSDTKIEALKLQSSAFGVTIPLVYGQNRIAGNMIWYGGFKATPHTTSSSGKGGSVNTQNTTFSYSASVMMGLCEGNINGVNRIWKGKKLYSGGPAPGQITTVMEQFDLSAAGGTITVAQAAAFSATLAVSTGTGRYSQIFSEGTDYTRVGGVYTFPPSGSLVRVYIRYQYASGAIQTSLQSLGLSYSPGTLGQGAWPYLTTQFPAQAIGYSGLALVYAQDYELGTGAQVDNHTFEVSGPHAYSISGSIPDGNPAPIAWDVLINGRYGAAFPSAQLGSIDLWSTYCLAAGLLMSPALTTQMQAGEFAALMGKLTNTAPVWSGGTLKMIPYGDTALTNNGATYTPDTTPAYDLGDDDFISKGGDPIRLIRKPQADAFNHVRVEFLNRANLYNVEIAEAKDSANIDIYGLRSAPILSTHWICDASIARTVAQLLMQRALCVRNTFEFTLPWTKALLEPMVLVTLTDAGIGLNKTVVRITVVSEAEDGDLNITAEEMPFGVAHAALYPTQTGIGYQHDYSVSPGSVSTPVIFEAPGALTANGLELYVAAAGANANWGGCRVWVSLDGTSYKQVGRLDGPSRYGTLNGPPSGGAVHVSLVAGALTSGSAADAAALNTLCFIGGASREYFTYAAATLTAALAYDLTYVATGVYGSAVGGHSSGDPFVRVDSAIAKSGPIDLGYVGKTVHVKCTSFNIYGAAEESLASVTDYTYAITGAQVLGNAGASAFKGISDATSDNVLSQGEKPPVILDYTAITADQSGIVSQATAYGKDPAPYNSAVTALTAYLNTLSTPVAWNSLSGTTTIDGPSFRAKFAAVYAARQALLNATAAAAGTVATYAGLSGVPGVAIANSAVSISTDGVLSGAGGGQVVRQPIVDLPTTTGAFGERTRNDPPADYAKGLSLQFKNMASLGIPSTGNGYVTLETNKGWQDNSGVNVVQYAYSNDGSTYKRWGLPLGTSWAGAWTLDLDRNSYIGDLNATVGATWGSNLTGQPSDAALLNVNVAIPRGTMNADPGLLDPANAWTWDSNITVQGPSVVTGALGVMYFSASTGTDKFASSKQTFPIRSNGTYNYSALLYASSGNDRNMYLVVDMYTANGTRLTGTDTGWGGGYAGYTFGGQPPVGVFTRCGGDFGSGTSRPIPATAAYCKIQVWFQYKDGGGSSAVQQAAEDIRLVDVTDSRAAALTSTWTGVSGVGKPADNATKNTVYYQAATPTSPTNGDLWYSQGAGTWNTYVSGAWQIVSDVTATKIAAGITGQGALATLNNVDTPQIVNNAVTITDLSSGEASVYSDGTWRDLLTSASMNVGAGSVSIAISLFVYPRLVQTTANGTTTNTFYGVDYQLLRIVGSVTTVIARMSSPFHQDSTAQNDQNTSISYSLSDSPGGAAIYKIQHSTTGGSGWNGNTNKRAMSCLGMRK